VNRIFSSESVKQGIGIGEDRWVQQVIEAQRGHWIRWRQKSLDYSCFSEGHKAARDFSFAGVNQDLVFARSFQLGREKRFDSPQ